MVIKVGGIKLKEIIQETQEIIYSKLNELIPDDSENLTKAIRYSILNKGKRLRPLLLMETAKIFTNLITEDIVTVAVAIEMIHTFSLIHDDLPALDNDDYRRGELTCHKKFNEADAILAGDALIPLCFEIILTQTKNLTAEEKCKIILSISKAIGYRGMCLGQSLDIEFEKLQRTKTSAEAEILNIYKTGYLFKSCIEIGCILGKATQNEQNNLVEYSLNFGKAFQLMDDLEDEEIKIEEIKKTKEKINQLVINAKKYLAKLKNKNQNSITVLELIVEFCLKN